MIKHTLSEEQEREAKLLEAKIHRAIDLEIAELARLLVSKSESDLFGLTEFQVRDLVLRVGVKAFQEHLHEKKTATAALR
jgi:nucleoid DNA-binding protein